MKLKRMESTKESYLQRSYLRLESDVKTFKFFIDVNGEPLVSTYTIRFSGESVMDDAKSIAEKMAGMDDSCSCQVWEVFDDKRVSIGVYFTDSDFLPSEDT